VTEVPRDAAHYLGIGIVDKGDLNEEEYRQLARNLALTEIASQLKVEIQSSIKVEQHESDLGISEQVDFISSIRTNEVLSGVETIEIWENRERFAIYMRLSKAQFEEQQRRLYSLRVQESEAFLKLADEELEHPDKVLGYLLNVVNQLGGVQDLILKYNESGVREILPNTDARISKWFADLRITPNQTEVEWIIPRGLRQPLEVRVTQESGGSVIPVAHFPMLVSADGERFKLQADENGVARMFSSQLENMEEGALISFKLDVVSLIADERSVAPRVLGMQVPEITLPFTIKGPRIQLNTSEHALGNPLDHSYISNPLKKMLQDELKAEFVAIEESPDFIVNVNVNTRKAGPPAEVYGSTVYKCFADLEVKVVDADSGEEFSTHAIKDVSGAGFAGYEAASQDALDDLVEKFEAELSAELLAIFTQVEDGSSDQ